MKLTNLVVFIFFSFLGWSQFSLESNFSSVHIGRNQNLTLNYQWNKLSLYSGVKYNFNKLDNFPVSTMIKKTAWATKNSENIGGVIGLKYDLVRLKNISFFSFFECQQSFTHTRHISVIYVGSSVPNPTSEYDLVYQNRVDIIGPWWIFENNIGLGYHVEISKGLYLTSKAGIGIVAFKNTDEKNIVIFSGGNWEFSEILSFGIGYKFNKSK